MDGLSPLFEKFPHLTTRLHSCGPSPSGLPRPLSVGGGAPRARRFFPICRFLCFHYHVGSGRKHQDEVSLPGAGLWNAIGDVRLGK